MTQPVTYHKHNDKITNYSNILSDHILSGVPTSSVNILYTKYSLKDYNKWANRI